MTSLAVFFSLLALGLAYPQHERKSQLDGRIVGGNAADILQFPYIVSLRKTLEGLFEEHICGGSIISENFVVTAGHCCNGEEASSLAVRVGNTVADKGEKHEISKLTLHPNYYITDGVPYNDICLLQVSTPFVYSNSIKAVSLPEANSEVSVGTVAVTAGWGSIYYGGYSVDSLREVSVPIVTQSLCVSEYGVNSKGANLVNDTMICAGYEKGGKDACSGDSGGPLTVSNTLVGLVSWGAECAEPKYPGVYTHLSLYRDWIKSVAGV